MRILLVVSFLFLSLVVSETTYDSSLHIQAPAEPINLTKSHADQIYERAHQDVYVYKDGVQMTSGNFKLALNIPKEVQNGKCGEWPIKYTGIDISTGGQATLTRKVIITGENPCLGNTCHRLADCTPINNNCDFKCDCKPGCRGNGKVCEDIDECNDVAIPYPCVPKATCRNIPECGGYKCECVDGLVGDGLINGTGCAPTFCKPGYEYNRFEKKCVDINECARGLDNCVPGQVCVNLEGSFRCEDITGATILQLAPGYDKFSLFTKDKGWYQYHLSDTNAFHDDLTVEVEAPPQLSSEIYSECGKYLVTFTVFGTKGNVTKNLGSKTRLVTVSYDKKSSVNPCTISKSDPILGKFANTCGERSRCAFDEDTCLSSCPCVPPFVGPINGPCRCDRCVVEVAKPRRDTKHCIVCNMGEPYPEVTFATKGKDFQVYSCDGKQITNDLHNLSTSVTNVTGSFKDLPPKLEVWRNTYEATDREGNTCFGHTDVYVEVENINALLKNISRFLDSEQIRVNQGLGETQQATSKLSLIYTVLSTLFIGLVFIILWNLLPEIFNLLTVCAAGAQASKQNYERAYRFLYRYTLCCTDKQTIEQRIAQQWVMLQDDAADE